MSFDKGSSENFFPEKNPDFASCGSPPCSPEQDTVGAAAAAVPPFCSDWVLAASPGDCTRTFLVFLVEVVTGSTCSPVLCRLRAFPFSCGGETRGSWVYGGRGRQQARLSANFLDKNDLVQTINSVTASANSWLSTFGCRPQASRVEHDFYRYLSA